MDNDDDGLSDWWELKEFGSLSPKPEEDPDKDGITNLIEFKLGTQANNGDDKPLPGIFYSYDKWGRVTDSIVVTPLE